MAEHASQAKLLCDLIFSEISALKADLGRHRRSGLPPASEQDLIRGSPHRQTIAETMFGDDVAGPQYVTVNAGWCQLSGRPFHAVRVMKPECVVSSSDGFRLRGLVNCCVIELCRGK
jgi:hypothetical protein